MIEETQDFAESPVVEEPQAAVKATVKAVQTEESGSISQADVAMQRSRLDKVKSRLRNEPKVRVRLMEDTPVFIDGYPMYIQGKVWVEVPESVAEILEQAGRF